jgi:hypothetical protein
MEAEVYSFSSLLTYLRAISPLLLIFAEQYPTAQNMLTKKALLSGT